MEAPQIAIYYLNVFFKKNIPKQCAKHNIALPVSNSYNAVNGCGTRKKKTAAQAAIENHKLQMGAFLWLPSC